MFDRALNTPLILQELFLKDFCSARLEENLGHTDLVLSAVVPESAVLTRPVGSVAKRLSTKVMLILNLNLTLS